MTLPLNYCLFTPGIKEILRQRKAEYIFSRQEPKFTVDVFETKEGVVEVYVHKRGEYQSLSDQKIRRAV